MWLKLANNSPNRVEPVSPSKGEEFLNDGQLNRVTTDDGMQFFLFTVLSASLPLYAWMLVLYSKCRECPLNWEQWLFFSWRKCLLLSHLISAYFLEVFFLTVQIIKDAQLLWKSNSVLLDEVWKMSISLHFQKIFYILIETLQKLSQGWFWDWLCHSVDLKEMTLYKLN